MIFAFVARARVRQRAAVAALGVFAALCAVTPSAALAAGSCDVTYRMTSAVTLASLILTSGYTAANGEFAGEFGAVDCTDLTGTIPIFNDNEGAELLGLSFFAPPPGFTGPIDLAVCTFLPNGAEPAPTDFVSSIELAGGLDGFPVAGVEVVVSNIDCSGVGATTTTTTTSTSTTTVSSSTSTTMPAPGACGDPGEDGITATDALFILGAAVGLQACVPCVCDVDGSGLVAASDALLALQAAVGSQVQLNCPAC